MCDIYKEHCPMRLKMLTGKEVASFRNSSTCAIMHSLQYASFSFAGVVKGSSFHLAR